MDHCEEYLELISASLDGALSPAEQEALEAHLAVCPDCQALLLELKAVREAVAGLPAAQPPQGLTDRILAAVAADNITPLPVKKAASPRWRRWGSLAAAAALVLLGTWGVWRSGIDGSKSSPEGSVVRSAPAAPAGVNETIDETAETVEVSSPVTQDTAAVGVMSVMTAALPDGSAAPCEPAEPDAPGNAALPDTAVTAVEVETSVEGSVTDDTDAEAVSPLEALKMVVDRCYGGSGYELTVDYDGLRAGCVLSHSGAVITRGEVVWDGLSDNGRYYLFSWTQAGQTEEEAALYRYAVPLNGGYVMWAGDVADGGETFRRTVNEE